MTQPAQPPVLAIQVGNTRIKMAVFRGEDPDEVVFIAKEDLAGAVEAALRLYEAIGAEPDSSVVIASVNKPVSDALVGASNSTATRGTRSRRSRISSRSERASRVSYSERFILTSVTSTRRMSPSAPPSPVPPCATGGAGSTSASASSSAAASALGAGWSVHSTTAGASAFAR
jgi:hypothetical protein